MSSILDNIDTIINDGDTHVIKTKLFDVVVNEIERSYTYNKLFSTEHVIKVLINNRKSTFEHLTVEDLKNCFHFDEFEIRQFCSDSSIVKNVQDTVYSFSIALNQGLEYCHGKYKCNLDNALYALTGGTFIIEIDDIDCGEYLIDVKSTPARVRDFVLNNVKKCSISLNPDFFDELTNYCLKKLV